MALNKTAKRALTAARKLALASVAPSAFASQQSYADCVASVAAAIKAGVPQELVRANFCAGIIASRLPSNSDEAARIADAHAVMALANANGTGGLKKGQSGRRNPLQEAAYNTAKVRWSGVLKDAGIKTTSARGAKATGRKPKAGQGKVKKTAANSNKPVAPKLRSREAIVGHVQLQAAALLAFANKNAALMPASIGEAIAAFKRATDAVEIIAA